MSMFIDLLRDQDGKPSGQYKQVKYIKQTSNMAVYIDLDKLYTVDLRYEFDIQIAYTNWNWTTLGSSTVAGSQNRFGYNPEYHEKTPNLFMIFSGSQLTSSLISGLIESRRIYTFIIEEGFQRASISDCDIYAVGNKVNITCEGNIRLFAHGSPEGDRYRGKIYGVKIYNSKTNELLVNLVPCYRKSDNIAGLYDVVNKKFYSSLTETQFEYVL